MNSLPPNAKAETDLVALMLNALRAALPVLMVSEDELPRIAERRKLVLDAIEAATGKRP